MEIMIIIGLILCAAAGATLFFFIFRPASNKTPPPKKKEAPLPKKAPVRFVNVSPDSGFEDSFMTVYSSLNWKPDREHSSGTPDNIAKIIEDIEAISPIVTEISSKLNDPDINPKDISRIIVTDQGLTSFILKRVNSPYYGLYQKVDNIFNAIVILGYNEIYRIVMEERTSRLGIKPSREEWIHANLTSTIAAYLANTSRIGVSSGTIVTLGMLHDIAKTIMARSLPQPEAGFSTDPRERLKQETELYGIDHAALGGILARQWKMPDRLSKAIEQHHWPMFWPVREIGQISGDIIKELAVLGISDVAAKNFMKEISGIYIGDDYYRFIKKPPRMEGILMPEIYRDLNRIKSLGEKNPNAQPKDSFEEEAYT